MPQLKVMVAINNSTVKSTVIEDDGTEKTEYLDSKTLKRLKDQSEILFAKNKIK